MLDTKASTPSPGVADTTSPPRPAGMRRPLDGPAVARLATAYAVLVGLGSLLGTFLTGWADDRSIGRLDRSISVWLEANRTSTLDALSNLGSGLADTLTVVVVLAALAAGFWFAWRRWDEITLLATALALEVTSFVSIAFVVGRNRPPVEQLDPSPPTSGFPSGHTAAAVALYFGLVLVVYRNTENQMIRLAATALATLVVIAVALSRMYRGMHFLTDVVAGAMLGAACVTIAWLVVRRYAARRHAGEDPWVVA